MVFFTLRVCCVAALLSLLLCFAGVPFPEQGQALASEDDSASKKKEGVVGHIEAEEVERQGKKDADISGGRFSGDPIYVHLPILVLPVISSNGAQQVVTILINIEVDSLGTANDIHDRRPRVMDSLMRFLYGKLGDGDLLEGKLVNVERVKDQVAKAIAEVTGPDKVRNVLIQGIAQRIY